MPKIYGLGQIKRTLKDLYPIRVIEEGFVDIQNIQISVAIYKALS
jgi:hypothetical protein